MAGHSVSSILSSQNLRIFFWNFWGFSYICILIICSRFVTLLSRLEKKPACKGRSLETFLTYPMHQVTIEKAGRQGFSLMKAWPSIYQDIYFVSPSSIWSSLNNHFMVDFFKIHSCIYIHPVDDKSYRFIVLWLKLFFCAKKKLLSSWTRNRKNTPPP